jgi:hypothetical protein
MGFSNSHLTIPYDTAEYWARRILNGVIFGFIPYLSIRMIYGFVKRRELREVNEMLTKVVNSSKS